MKQDLCRCHRLHAGAGYWHAGGEQNVAKTREHKCKKEKTLKRANRYWCIRGGRDSKKIPTPPPFNFPEPKNPCLASVWKFSTVDKGGGETSMVRMFAPPGKFQEPKSSRPILLIFISMKLSKYKPRKSSKSPDTCSHHHHPTRNRTVVPKRPKISNRPNFFVF